MARPDVQRARSVPLQAQQQPVPSARQLVREQRQARQAQQQQDRMLRQQQRMQVQAQQRQERIQRLQQRVQQLQQTGQATSRKQQRLLQAQERALQREQRIQARQQNLFAPPVARLTSPEAMRGRFAGRYQADPARVMQLRQAAAFAPRQAWRHGLRAAFIPWAGAVYWPYAYSDIFDYTFWPRAYDEGYWAYAYDDFIDNVFWASGSPYAHYAHGREETLRPGARSTARSRTQAFSQLCSDPGSGVTAWPFAQIESTLQLTPEQRTRLDEMKQAAARAADAFKASCANSFPLTPPGRVAAMTNRIDATLEAVRMVRPALERFYESLTDEQKARFNAIGPKLADNTATPPEQQANTCAEAKPELGSLPIQRIEEVLRPAGAQKDALDRLSQATQHALQMLQAACPDVTPVTPVGRLEVMERRLEAMSKGAHTVQPALEQFYASLSNEQKERFNTLNAQASR